MPIHAHGLQWFDAPLTSLRLTHVFPPFKKIEKEEPVTKAPVSPPMRYFVYPWQYPRILKRTELSTNAMNMNGTRYAGYDPYRILTTDIRILRRLRTEPTEIHGQETLPVWVDDTEPTKNLQNKRMQTVLNNI